MPRFSIRLAFLTFLILFSSFAVQNFSVQAADEIKPVKYVFLFIGDGLSIPQRMMAEDYLRVTENGGLCINAMTSQAVTTTRSANDFITDSAASGTAIACGEKTNNGFIGVGPDGTRFESVAEVAQKQGRKVGIITSVTLNHATPASFYAHNASRGNAYDIGLDFIASGFDYFGGGGFSNSNDEKSPNYRGDLYELAKQTGYTISRNKQEFQKINANSGKTVSIGAPEALPYAIDTPPDALRLADFTRQGIELLDNPNGFFMMVEGGAIDWMCHANDAATTLGEIIEFDKAVAVAVEFAKVHPGETLIVVTGDHETGGLTLGFAGAGYSSNIALLANQKVSTDKLAKLITQFVKDHEGASFNDIKPLIVENSGFIFVQNGERQKGEMNLTESEEKDLENAFNKCFEEGKLKDGSVLARAIVRIVNGKAGLGWSSGSHTALPVSTTALGAESEHFSNMIDNTDIAKRLKLTVQ